MTRQEYMLAVLEAGDGTPHTPVQVQKLFFLLDRRVPDRIGGPWFQFEPYDYGPFDKAVYEELRGLAWQDLVAIEGEPSSLRAYRLTDAGRATGRDLLGGIPAPTADYIRHLSAWVRGLSFAALVSAIYQAFPEMKARSVFRSAR